MNELHLLNAARTLQAILNRRDPEHSYTVRVREGDRDDSACTMTAATLWQNDEADQDQ